MMVKCQHFLRIYTEYIYSAIAFYNQAKCRPHCVYVGPQFAIGKILRDLRYFRLQPKIVFNFCLTSLLVVSNPYLGHMRHFLTLCANITLAVESGNFNL